MVDPITALGAAAAAAQIAEQIIKTTIAIAQIYSKVKKGPEIIHKQLLRIYDVAEVCKLVKGNPALQTDTVENLVKSCLDKLNEIGNELKKVSGIASNGAGQRAWKAVLGVMRDKEFEKLFEDLDRLQSTLMLCINEVVTNMLNQLDYTVSRMDTNLCQISLDVNDTKLRIRHISQDVSNTNASSARVETSMINVERNVASILEKIRDLETKTTSSPFQAQLASLVNFKVPCRRTKTFFGRHAVLQTLDQAFSSTSEDQPHIAVIRGMGGQGKTQIALHYCWTTRSNPYTFVLWVDASSEASVRSTLKATADALQPGPNLEGDAIVDFVLDYLSRRTEPWLMVFDNFDMVDYRIQDFFPSSGRGSIIVTSRHASTKELVDNEENFIELEGLEEEAAIALLYRLTKAKESTTTNIDAHSIVKRLEYHALAITQAATYIHKQKISLANFMAHYESRRANILNTTPTLTEYRRKLGPEDTETALNVFTTWELTFQQLQKQEREDNNQVKVRLLTLCAFFDNQDISELLFRGAKARVSSRKDGTLSNDSLALLKYLECFKSAGVWDQDEFSEALNTLYELSLIQSWERRASDNLVHITIHPLVRDWIRLRLTARERQENTYMAWLLLGTTFYESFDRKAERHNLSVVLQQEMVLHVQAHQRNQQEFFPGDSSFVTTEVARDAHKCQHECAFFMYRTGHYVVTKTILQHTVQFFQLMQGPGDWWTRRSLSRLVYTVSMLEEYSKAKELLETLLELVLTEEGFKSDNYFKTAGYLAYTMGRLKQFSNAEALLTVLLRESEDAFGNRGNRTLAICRRLGLVLNLDGRFEEAESWFQRAWQGYTDKIGPLNEKSLASLTHLASATASTGRWDEALELIKQAQIGFESSLGPQHPKTVLSERYKDAISRQSISHLRDISNLTTAQA